MSESSFSVVGVDRDTISSAIHKYIDIKHESIIESKVSATASNTLEGDVVIARGVSKLTIEQSNLLKQQVEVVYIYKEMNDMTDEELLVTESIRDRFNETNGFWDEDYIRSLLGEEYSDADIVMDLNENVIKATWSTGETEVIPMSDMEALLVADYEHNENTFNTYFLSYYQHSIDALYTAAEAVQSNRMYLKDVTLVESQAEWKQTNETIQEVTNRLSRAAEDLEKRLDEEVDEVQDKIDDIKIKEEIDGFLVFIVIIAAIILSAIFFLLFIMPSLRAASSYSYGGDSK